MSYEAAMAKSGGSGYSKTQNNGITAYVFRVYSQMLRHACLSTDRTVNSNLVPAWHQYCVHRPQFILMHELVGHAIPATIGSDSGNAVTDENKVRGEIGMPLRQAEPSHVEF